MPLGTNYCGKCRHFERSVYGNICRVVDTSRTDYQGKHRYRFRPEVKNACNNCDEYQYKRTMVNWLMEKLYNLVN